jgi:tetratricopeptide (TPR) repeat protein
MSMMVPATYRLAVQHFSRALELNPNLQEAYVQRGTAYQNLGQLDQALQDLDRALAANPKDQAALIARGIVYRDRKDLHKAIDDFSRVLEIRADIDAYHERAQTYEAIGEYAKAIADLDRVVQSRQEDPNLLRARALAKRKMGDEAGYRADMDAARDLETRVKKSLK